MAEETRIGSGGGQQGLSKPCGRKGGKNELEITERKEERTIRILEETNAGGGRKGLDHWKEKEHAQQKKERKKDDPDPTVNR